MRRSTLLLVALLVAGCSAVGGRPPEVRTFRLAYRPPLPAAGTTRMPVVVRVVPFGVAAAYDRLSFLYRYGPQDLGVDYYNRWVASPAAIITDLLGRDLATSGALTAAITTPAAVPADYELGGQVETIEERDDQGCVAHLRLSILLARVPRRGPRYVVLQDSFVADEPCVRGDPTAYAAAMSAAMQRLSEEIRAAVLLAIARDQEDSRG